MRDLRLGAECATGVAFPPKRTRRGPPRDDRQDLPIFQNVGRHVRRCQSVRDWKVEWERTWDGDATGADVKAQMEVLEVCDEELDGRRTLHARASIPWSVAIHAGSGSAAAQEVAKRGELLCQKMLPRVPIPRAPLVIGSRPRITIGWPTVVHC